MSFSNIIVHVISARSLPAADVNGKSDPYCIVQLRGGASPSHKTDKKSKTLDPVWNQTFSFKNVNLMTDALAFTVFDYDRFTSDDKLGDALFPLSRLIQTPIVDEWIDLHVTHKMNLIEKAASSSSHHNRATPGIHIRVVNEGNSPHGTPQTAPSNAHSHVTESHTPIGTPHTPYGVSGNYPPAQVYNQAQQPYGMPPPGYGMPPGYANHNNDNQPPVQFPPGPPLDMPGQPRAQAPYPYGYPPQPVYGQPNVPPYGIPPPQDMPAGYGMQPPPQHVGYGMPPPQQNPPAGYGMPPPQNPHQNGHQSSPPETDDPYVKFAKKIGKIGAAALDGAMQGKK